MTTSLTSQLTRLDTEPVDLLPYLDCTGVTARDALGDGAFNIWSNSFPAEELPSRGSDVDVHGVPFRFPADHPAGYDNVRCARQRIEVPVGSYDWIQLLTSAERRTEDQVVLRFVDGAMDGEWLRVSDFWPETPSHFGESPAFRCTRMHYPRHIQRNMRPVIWRQRVAIPRQQQLAAIILPDNPAIHIFAMTLVRARTGTEAAA